LRKQKTWTVYTTLSADGRRKSIRIPDIVYHISTTSWRIYYNKI